MATRKKPSAFCSAYIPIFVSLFIGIAFPAVAEILPRFEIGTFCCGCTSSNQNFCEQHFDALNFRGSRGHYFAMGSDSRRLAIEQRGNRLAVYHNDLNTLYTQKTPLQKGMKFMLMSWNGLPTQVQPRTGLF